jgi:hypothetical protein
MIEDSVQTNADVTKAGIDILEEKADGNDDKFYSATKRRQGKSASLNALNEAGIIVDDACGEKADDMIDKDSCVPSPVTNGLNRQRNFHTSHSPPGAYEVTRPIASTPVDEYERTNICRNPMENESPAEIYVVQAELVTVAQPASNTVAAACETYRKNEDPAKSDIILVNATKMITNDDHLSSETKNSHEDAVPYCGKRYLAAYVVLLIASIIVTILIIKGDERVQTTIVRPDKKSRSDDGSLFQQERRDPRKKGTQSLCPKPLLSIVLKVLQSYVFYVLTIVEFLSLCFYL